MRKTLANSHFSVVDGKSEYILSFNSHHNYAENLYWLGFWGRHMTSKRYRTVFPHQKVLPMPKLHYNVLDQSLCWYISSWKKGSSMAKSTTCR